MRMPGVVYTRLKDGGVDICYPLKSTVRFMNTGGFYNQFQNPKKVAEKQIGQWIKKYNIDPDIATKYVHSLYYGGLNTSQAIQTILEKDCFGKGENFQFVEKDLLPCDRWFRDAWVRNSNGNVIIDLEKAKKIHWTKLGSYVIKENNKRLLNLDGPPPLEFYPNDFRNYIKRASSVEELRRIWIN